MNLAEVFNYVMKGVRFLPLTTLVEFTFYRINEYFVQRCEHASAWLLGGHMYTSHATKIINRNIEKENFHEIIAFDYRRGVLKLRPVQDSTGIN